MSLKPLLESGSVDEAKSFCRRFDQNTLRLSLIRSDGTVEADSAQGVFDNHLERQEVRDALVGTPKCKTRYSKSLRRWMTYYAVRIDTAHGMFIIRSSVSTDRTARIVNMAKNTMWLALLSGGALVLLLVIYLLIRVRRPLRDLRSATAKIADGVLDTPIPIPPKGIVHDIALGVAEMTDRLKKQLVEMQKLESFRSDFIANVSHEIKTPLTCIIGVVETIQDEPDLPEDQYDKLIRMLYEQSNRLNSLVMDILSLSALENRRDARRKEFLPVDLADVLEESRIFCAALAEQAGIALKIASAEPLTVSGDAQLLEQAVINLINNAVKYSGSPVIELAVVRKNDTAVLSVTDHGCGIPMEHQTRIFERFYRIHKERSRALGGTGLGLAIVKHTAQLHGGKAELHPVAEGGCCFQMILPISSEE